MQEVDDVISNHSEAISNKQVEELSDARGTENI
jgi:hypothetical protein